VAGCLKKNPDERYQSMRQVQTELAALKRQSDSAAFPQPALPAPPPPRSSRAPAIGVTAFLAVLIVGGGVYWWQTPHTAPAPASSPAAITNNSILDMVQAGVAPSVIESQIRSSKTDFDLSSAEVIRLSKAGVPAEVIEVMRNPLAKPSPAEPAVATPVPKPTPEPAAPPSPVVSTATVVLGDGLPVRLVLAQDVAADAVEGDVLQFKVADDVLVNDIVVIPKDAAATGSIVTRAKKRVLGIGGKMTLRLDSVSTADGEKVPIRATSAPRRDGLSIRPVTTAAAGTGYIGYIDGSNTVTVKK
jgi:hypothetical protein